MLTVHHLNNSRSQRVLWMLEELAVPYQIVFYQRDPETMLAPAALKAVHPLGKSPVITDEGKTIAESGAILQYLVDRYGAGRMMPAADTPERLDYNYFMHYAEGSLMPPLLLKLVFRRIPQSVPFLIRPVAGKISQGVQQRLLNPQLAAHVAFLDQHLSRSPWFAGAQLTAADVQMSFPVEALMARVDGGAQASHLKQFLERIHARPAYQVALEKGGPFSLGA